VKHAAIGEKDVSLQFEFVANVPNELGVE